MKQAVGFNSGPEFNFVRRQTDKISGHILAGRRIHICTAVFRIEPVYFVGNVITAVLGLQLLQLCSQAQNAFLIAIILFDSLGIERLTDLFNSCQ